MVVLAARSEDAPPRAAPGGSPRLAALARLGEAMTRCILYNHATRGYSCSTCYLIGSGVRRGRARSARIAGVAATDAVSRAVVGASGNLSPSAVPPRT